MKKIVWVFVTFLAAIPAVRMFASQGHAPTHLSSAAAGPGWSSFAEGMARMHSAMGAVGPSGNADADFAGLMLPHHQGAVDMARAELLYGTDPQMRRLAQEIVTDQQSEVALMQLWLKQHNTNSVEEKPAAAVRAGQER